MSETYLDEVQRLVERLSSQIRRSVAIDDPDGSLIAVSRHYGDADNFRIRLILSRRSPPQYREYFRSFMSATMSAPVAVPANDDLGLFPRICFPICKNSMAFAFLWVIDTGEPLRESLVLSYCDRLAELLHERGLHDDRVVDPVVSQFLSSLLAGESGDRTRPQKPGLARVSRTSRFLVVAAHAPHDVRSQESAQGVLRALPPLVMDLGLHLACLSVVHDCAVGVYDVNAPEPPAEAIDEDRLVSEVSGLVARRHAEGRFGLSPLCGVSRIHRSFAEAALASFLCTQLFQEARVLSWRAVEHLGMFISSGRSFGTTPGLCALDTALRDPADFTFETLEALLHHETTEAAAESLQIHRTTLHYRIARIQEKVGLNPRDPADRFLYTALWLQVAADRSGLSHLLASG